MDGGAAGHQVGDGDPGHVGAGVHLDADAQHVTAREAASGQALVASLKPLGSSSVNAVCSANRPGKVTLLSTLSSSCPPSPSPPSVGFRVSLADTSRIPCNSLTGTGALKLNRMGRSGRQALWAFSRSRPSKHQLHFGRWCQAAVAGQGHVFQRMSMRSPRPWDEHHTWACTLATVAAPLSCNIKSCSSSMRVPW